MARNTAPPHLLVEAGRVITATQSWLKKQRPYRTSELSIVYDIKGELWKLQAARLEADAEKIHEIGPRVNRMVLRLIELRGLSRRKGDG